MTYTHGHHESVLRSHTWRTAENSAAYLLPHLRPGLSLLDIGCGPGTITADLARLVAPGPVIGLDASRQVVAQAQDHANTAGVTNVRFEVGDLFALEHDDAAFDVVHAHQVLQHLGDPRSALAELRRVLRLQLYLDVTKRNGHNARIGPSLLGLARAVGFTDVSVSSTCWTFADPESRRWWGGLWADRVRFSRLAEQAVAYELSDADELESIARAFLEWAASPDGVFVVPHVEILARR